MTDKILYFHGFKSSSDSTKAKNFKKFVLSNSKNTEVIIPNLDDCFQKAFEQINNIIELNEGGLSFMGSSLGGYYACYFAQKYQSKAVLINPAIPPLKNFEIHLGKNENYSTGNKFLIDKDDINFIRSLSYKKLLFPENFLILLESGDEILNYDQSASYYSGAHIDILFGGDHSYLSFSNKFDKIKKFLDIS